MAERVEVASASCLRSAVFSALSLSFSLVRTEIVAFWDSELPEPPFNFISLYDPNSFSYFIWSFLFFCSNLSLMLASLLIFCDLLSDGSTVSFASILCKFIFFMALRNSLCSADAVLFRAMNTNNEAIVSLFNFVI